MTELLTKAELHALDLTGDLAKLLYKIVAGTKTTEQDQMEVATFIHGIQTFVMSQAAARAYPGKFRLMGDQYGDN